MSRTCTTCVPQAASTSELETDNVIALTYRGYISFPSNTSYWPSSSKANEFIEISIRYIISSRSLLGGAQAIFHTHQFQIHGDRMKAPFFYGF